MRKLFVVEAVGFALVALTAGLFSMSTQPQGFIPSFPSMTTVTIGKTTIQVEVASTAAERQRGLSGRASLQSGHGMLFVFAQPSADGFWMKDMHVSLDIIWADQNGVITTIEQHLSPDTYPRVFYPASPARYVLEVPAGFAASHGIAVGGKLVVQWPQRVGRQL